MPREPLSACRSMPAFLFSLRLPRNPGPSSLSPGPRAPRVLPHHRRHHPGDPELMLRLDGFTFRVRGHEVRRIAAFFQELHGPLAVHLGDHDVSALRGLAPVHDDQVAWQDAGAGHGIARDFEQEGGVGVRDEELVEGEGVPEFLLGRARKPRLHEAQDPVSPGSGCRGGIAAFFAFSGYAQIFETMDYLQNHSACLHGCSFSRERIFGPRPEWTYYK